jgi:hypothetical protein
LKRNSLCFELNSSQSSSMKINLTTSAFGIICVKDEPKALLCVSS